MSMYDIILNKRDGGTLSKEEIDFFIEGYTNNEIPDYQASALLMAIYFKNLSKAETFLLTDAMKRSGDVVDLSGIAGIKVDKHSTGGVGDKTTLVVGPLAASCGVPIAKMSGRGLGFTGGTVDKMESIPGFRTALESEEFIELVNKVGLAVIGQTAHIAAADKKLYALRDVTATVDNIGLISSSIMSKKLASGSDAILLDVKCGNGAFMENLEDAIELGTWMVDIGKAAGKKTVAFITDMSQPLGHAIGNALEVIEAIETLKSRGPEDITELALKLSAYMVYIGEKADSPESALEMVKEKLRSGAALNKLSQFIQGQGGDPKVIEDYNLFPKAQYELQINAESSGFVHKIDARAIGRASQHAGAGRETKEDILDLSAGIVLHKKVGDEVQKDEVLAILYGNDLEKLTKASEIAAEAFTILGEQTEKPILIKKIIL
jgi:pyrimidine-nucleoside phosphorylase